MQDATVLSYKQTFDEWPETDKFRVAGVSYNPETGVIGIQVHGNLRKPDQTIIEFWQGCEFIEGTDWWESRYGSDEPFEGYTTLSEGDERQPGNNKAPYRLRTGPSYRSENSSVVAQFRDAMEGIEE